MARMLPDVKSYYEKDLCMDSSVCTQGLKVKTKNTEFVITKDNCIKYGYKWYEEDKSCDLKSK